MHWRKGMTMRRALTLIEVIVGIALTVSLWTGRAVAEEGFRTLAGIPVAAMSHNEMAAVEGRAQGTALAVLGPGGVLYSAPGQKIDPTLLVNLGGVGATGSKLRTNALALLDPGGVLYTTK